jgi:molybdopterin-containing oxidoreductase family membrane subunit
MGLVIPGFTPSTLGDIYEYWPSGTELAVAAGIYGTGFLAFTCMAKVATAVMKGELRARSAAAQNDAAVSTEAKPTEA